MTNFINIQAAQAAGFTEGRTPIAHRGFTIQRIPVRSHRDHGVVGYALGVYAQDRKAPMSLQALDLEAQTFGATERIALAEGGRPHPILGTSYTTDTHFSAAGYAEALQSAKAAIDAIAVSV